MPEDPPSDPDKPEESAVKLHRGRLEIDDRRVWMIDAASALYALKRSLMWDVGVFEKDFLSSAAQEGAKEYLSGLLTDELRADPQRLVSRMLETYSRRGHGHFELEKLDLDHKVAEFSCRDSIEAWSFQVNRDMQRNPVCSYASGVLSYIGRMVFGGTPEDPEILAFETECAVQGNERCRFVVGPAEELKKRFPRFEEPRDSVSEHDLKLSEEILTKNLELQNANLSLERQIRRKTEELRRSEENYRSLIDLSPDPILMCTEKGDILSANESALRMLGHAPKELEGAAVSAILGGGGSDWSKILWTLEKEGSAHGLGLELLRKDGSRVMADVSARRADLPQGRSVEIVARDVTARESADRDLEEAREEAEFLNDLLSHDIINYTFSALHFVANLKKSSRLTEDDRRSLSIVAKDIQGAYELASSVRDMSRAKHMDKEEVGMESLQLMILQGIEDAKAMYADRHPTINYQKTPEPRFVRGHTLLSRLFSNVISNGIKFTMSNDPEVDITVDSSNEGGEPFWKVSISDRGRGIPDAEKERVFEKFHKLDASIEGNGLGLYVSRFVAGVCGGRIWAEDRVPGDPSKGTTIVVLLRKADQNESQSRRPAQTSGITILGH